MTKKKALLRDVNRPPVHPGEIYRTISIPAIDKPYLQIANDLQISRQHLHALINGKKPFTTDTARRFARYFGGSARTILKLQMEYDLYHTKKSPDLAKIPKYKGENASA